MLLIIIKIRYGQFRHGVFDLQDKGSATADPSAVLLNYRALDPLQRSRCITDCRLLTRKEMYVDLDEDYFNKQKQQSIVMYAVRRLENLGYSVTIAEVS
ncbi:hypothetical protein ACP8HI_04705 [Paenibacillus sp. FA6]|uniref:hypothetical protein n=1 Tax=Paenibacillus sp. FA6 TaxID=3413029 RepID=UPI003F65831E